MERYGILVHQHDLPSLLCRFDPRKGPRTGAGSGAVDQHRRIAASERAGSAGSNGAL